MTIKLRSGCTAILSLTLSIIPGYLIGATIHFTGHITQVSSNSFGSIATLSRNDPVSGYFSYDPTSAADSNSWDVYGQYRFDASNSALGVTVQDLSNNLDTLFQGHGSLNEIQITNDWTYPGYPTIDGYNPNGIVTWNGAPYRVYLRFQRRENGPVDLLASDSLLAAPPPLDLLNISNGSILDDTSSFSNADFLITSVTVVPIPATMPLMASGMLILFGIKRLGSQST